MAWERLGLNERQYRRAQFLRMKLEEQAAESAQTVLTNFAPAESQFGKEFETRFAEVKRLLSEFHPHAMSVRVAAEALHRLHQKVKELRLAARFAAQLSLR
ncbi:MAG: hypothetical protein Q7S05_04205 [bacterium]|nr:hypothetical protein [bacterium]